MMSKWATTGSWELSTKDIFGYIGDRYSTGQCLVIIQWARAIFQVPWYHHQSPTKDLNIQVISDQNQKTPEKNQFFPWDIYPFFVLPKKLEANCKHSTWEKMDIRVPMETKLYQEVLAAEMVGVDLFWSLMHALKGFVFFPESWKWRMGSSKI